ncbi:MAG: hypothetical protein DRJ42_10325 [Deltaproteobacteria bacterium]|nr:MAG: hypothetical protein DRJ42_10325 [Deltaproteobacteria bacterium]
MDAGDSSAPTACTDGMRNGDETSLDCGGSCPPCSDGSGCSVGADCASGVCRAGFCLVPNCMDGAANGDESDVDCGGSCDPCDGGLSCSAGTDCRSGICEAGICAVTGCTDGTRNGEESDVDCGGSECPACFGGSMCAAAEDCLSMICSAGFCTTATCDDTVRNAEETDIDCGGSRCPGCATGLACMAPGDCADGVCSATVCLAPGCADGVHNGDETDVDCGGSTCMTRCAETEMCMDGADCDSGVCGAGNTCEAPTCTDGVHNGGETDVDCGGAGSCPRCADGLDCMDPSDCLTMTCTSGSCGTVSATGCRDGSVEVTWDADVHGCRGPTQTWQAYFDNQATYCNTGWRMARGWIVNAHLTGPGYTDDVKYTFDGELCGSSAWVFATRHDGYSQSRSSCGWSNSHHWSLGTAPGNVAEGIVCERTP